MSCMIFFWTKWYISYMKQEYYNNVFKSMEEIVFSPNMATQDRDHKFILLLFKLNPQIYNIYLN